MNNLVENSASLDRICDQISLTTACNFRAPRIEPVTGGSISTTVILRSNAASYFVKLNSPDTLPMFDAESDGLLQLAAANALRVPTPICHGADHNCAWLVLEHLVALGSSVSQDWDQLGRALAQLHQHSHSLYGWHRNNTIGSSLQINKQTSSWTDFLREHRLGFQLDLAARNGFGGRLRSQGNMLLDDLEHFFADYAPEPALLHGDLWSGNVGFVENGEPVIFDPAVYFGDRETDIAMSELFGRFDLRFYRAYENAWPLDKGYKTRKHLYHLYHLLNHLNLFGQSYLAQCEATLDRLLTESGISGH